MKLLRFLQSLFFWRWRKRWKCHGSLSPCRSSCDLVKELAFNVKKPEQDEGELDIWKRWVQREDLKK